MADVPSVRPGLRSPHNISRYAYLALAVVCAGLCASCGHRDNSAASSPNSTPSRRAPAKSETWILSSTSFFLKEGGSGGRRLAKAFLADTSQGRAYLWTGKPKSGSSILIHPVRQWSERLEQAAAAWNRSGPVDSNAVADRADALLGAWNGLLAAKPDARKTIAAALRHLPPLMRLRIPQSGERMTPRLMRGLRRALYADMLWHLELVIGPILPYAVDPSGAHWRANIASIRTWWRLHCTENRTQWMLESLASKGYNTGYPARSKRTLRALILALRSGSRNGLDRMAAARLLNRVCPAMPALMAPPARMDAPPGGRPLLEISAMYYDSISAAIVWYFQFGRFARWNPATDRYQILNNLKRPTSGQPRPIESKNTRWPS